MATTKEQIREWLLEAREECATHVLVVCDTYDHGDFPVQVMPGVEPQEVYDQYHGKNMQKVMEVYALHLDLTTQLDEERSMHLETKPMYECPFCVADEELHEHCFRCSVHILKEGLPRFSLCDRCGGGVAS